MEKKIPFYKQLMIVQCRPPREKIEKQLENIFEYINPRIFEEEDALRYLPAEFYKNTLVIFRICTDTMGGNKPFEAVIRQLQVERPKEILVTRRICDKELTQEELDWLRNIAVEWLKQNI